MYATQIIKNTNGEDFTMASLAMQVNGFQFLGKVYIATANSRKRLHYTLRLHTIKFYSIFALQRLSEDQTPDYNVNKINTSNMEMTNKRLEAIKNSGIRKKLDDIDLNLNWGEFAHNYFDRSASWFYNKLNGIDGNGGVGGFTEEELTVFKGGLCDLADRLRKAADKL